MRAANRRRALRKVNENCAALWPFVPLFSLRKLPFLSGWAEEEERCNVNVAAPPPPPGNSITDPMNSSLCFAGEGMPGAARISLLAQKGILRGARPQLSSRSTQRSSGGESVLLVATAPLYAAHNASSSLKPQDLPQNAFPCSGTSKISHMSAKGFLLS